MYFFPWAKIRIRTSMRKADVLSRLDAALDNSGWLKRMFNDDPSKGFTGKIKDDNFKIMRIIRYRNSFNPVIIGRCEEERGETVIYLKFRMIRALYFFAGLWLLICGGALAGSLYAVFSSGEPIFISLIPLVMILLFWWSSTGFLHMERRRAEQTFKLIWEGSVER